MLTGKLQILIAEDNRVFADVIRFNLEQEGYAVTVAHDGRLALERSLAQQFDLVISDHQMPHMTGLEFCRELRKDPRHVDTYLFLCSAKGYELNVEALRKELNLTDVLIKPFSPKQLVQTVNALFRAEAIQA